MKHHYYTVELRVRAPQLDPATVTRALGVEPTFAQAPGESPNPKGREFGVWGYGATADDGSDQWSSLEAGLEATLRQLQPFQTRISGLQKQFDVYWWCGHFQVGVGGGPRLPPLLLRKLADFGVELVVCCYPTGDDE